MLSIFQKSNVLSFEHLSEASIFLCVILRVVLRAANKAELVEVGNQSWIVSLGEQGFNQAWKLVNRGPCNLFAEDVLQEFVESQRGHAFTGTY